MSGSTFRISIGLELDGERTEKFLDLVL